MKRRRSSSSPRKLARSGIAVIVVLGLLAITLALSYAMLRTQVTSSQIQSNLGKRGDARQAAMTGLSIGLRKMHEANWSGVDTALTGNISSRVTYRVTYATGDAMLNSTSSDWSLYPYRVTVTSTGSAADPNNPTIVSTHTVQAVVQLVPRKLSNTPNNWNSLQDYTLYQWSSDGVRADLPVRVEGRSKISGEINLAPTYPGDCRPWNGRLDEVAIFDRALSSTDLSNITSMTYLGSLPSLYNSRSPLYWWRFNETSSASSAAAQAGGVAGSLENGAKLGDTGVPMLFTTNRAAYFDGEDDYVSVGNVNVFGSALSLVAWVRADSFDNSTDSSIVSKATGTSDSDHYWMLGVTKVGSNVRLRFRLRTNGSTQTLTASSGNLQTGTWYFAAATYDGSRMRLYLNGDLVGESTKSGNLNTNSSVPVFIGDNPPGSPRTRYMKDLEAMRVAGLGDYRPVNGPLETLLTRTSESARWRIQDGMNVSMQNTAAFDSAPLSLPTQVTTYRLFPGGKSYAVQDIGVSTLTANLVADPAANPLGLFRRAGSVDFRDGVQLKGSLITSGNASDVTVSGDHVRMSAVTLPPLYGTTQGVQLPVVIASDDMLIDDEEDCQIDGFVVTGDEFEFEAGTQSAGCELRGRLITSRLIAGARSQWSNISNQTWIDWYQDFTAQLTANNAIAHFPNWVQQRKQLPASPKLKITPPTNVTYHWPDWTQPIFIVHPSDTGLRWDIIRWTDSP